ncbi:MAG TPA: 4'-phosphopantetheinyl transferase superfamily protein [Cellulomonadaceae bacterium]|nr:4'-phosphopantetheinyl transferase superfamily protein [Cellulomonadaceae bacterium]
MASPRMEDPAAAQLIEIAWTWASSSLAHGLTPEERDRYHRLRRQVDRDMFATGRAVLRLVAGARMDIEPHEVVVRTTCARCGSTSHGAPTVDPVDGARAAPHISVTHAAGLVMVAATDVGRVGVDCEPLAGALVPGFADVALAPQERASLTGAPPDALLRTWVRKEALLKAAGRGLETDPRGVVLSPWWEPPHVVATPSGTSSAGWQLVDVDPVVGFVGAVASASARSGALKLAVRRVDLRRSDVRSAPRAQAAQGA